MQSEILDLVDAMEVGMDELEDALYEAGVSLGGLKTHKSIVSMRSAVRKGRRDAIKAFTEYVCATNRQGLYREDVEAAYAIAITDIPEDVCWSVASKYWPAQSAKIREAVKLMETDKDTAQDLYEEAVCEIIRGL